MCGRFAAQRFATECFQETNVGKLDGKIAVITGGSAGMGLATAKLFVREGAKVLITGRDQGALDTATRDIGEGAEAFRSDISQVADIEALRVHVAGKYGRVDILFANAGGGVPGPFEQVSEDAFDFTVNTNLKGTFFTVQKLVTLMPAGGSVILNTSVAGSKGVPGFIVYSATKAAIRSLARSLTAELSAKGIRVNAMAPGFIDTLTRICTVHDLTLEVHQHARTIAQAHSYSIYDAQIIAAALTAECKTLWSEDMQNGRVFEGGLRIVNPFAGLP